METLSSSKKSILLGKNGFEKSNSVHRFVLVREASFGRFKRRQA